MHVDISQADAINPKGIFANNLLRLEEVDVYGFDYDYTLALYKKTLDGLIFNLGVKSLVEVVDYFRVKEGTKETHTLICQHTHREFTHTSALVFKH